jgi:hypothetical protein
MRAHRQHATVGMAKLNGDPSGRETGVSHQGRDAMPSRCAVPPKGYQRP